MGSVYEPGFKYAFYTEIVVAASPNMTNVGYPFTDNRTGRGFTAERIRIVNDHDQNRVSYSYNKFSTADGGTGLDGELEPDEHIVDPVHRNGVSLNSATGGETVRIWAFGGETP